MTTMSLSQLLDYRKRLIAFRDSPEAQEIKFEWRIKLHEEIENISNEIDPITIKDFGK